MKISAGHAHTCVVTNDGYGQLGDGTTIDRAAPVDVIELSEPAVAIWSGRFYTRAASASGATKCWGATDSPTPARR